MNDDLPPVVSREEWLVARRRLLELEKEETRRRDALAAERRRLPMVELTKEYVLEGPDGPVTLLDVFERRRQLVVYHFMFDPEWEQGCSSCSFNADNVPATLSHLHSRRTTFAVVSRAPMDRIAPFRRRMGWTFPWYSSYGGDFNYDFHVTSDETVRPVEYNYRSAAELERLGHTWHLRGEQPGTSVFLRDGDRVFHTYSAYARGDELLLTTYNYLDLTPLGRQEDGTGIGDFPHHDRYGDPAELGTEP
ncbi:MAG TPA: DUF899 domain-containing protein [Pseudonocardiaceae bacterium]